MNSQLLNATLSYRIVQGSRALRRIAAFLKRGHLAIWIEPDRFQKQAWFGGTGETAESQKIKAVS